MRSTSPVLCAIYLCGLSWPADQATLFSVTLGGSEDDTIRAVAVDREGNAYVTGETNSPDFPALDPQGVPSQDRRPEQTHVFIAKIPAGGGKPVYATYIAGSGSERAFGIAVDAAGDAWIAGETSSPDFPVARNAFQKTKGGGWDAFVLKLDPSGKKILYATYLGGADEDRARAVSVEPGGAALVAGYTKSADFPVTGPALRRKTASFDAFVARIAPDGALSCATLLGGRLDEYAFGIASDAQGDAYVTGQTNSPDFPVTSGAFRPAKPGFWNAFVTRINLRAGRIVYSALLGGTRDAGGRGTTYGTAIAVAADGSAYVVGHTDAVNFPTTPGAAHARSAGGLDAFVTHLDAKGAAVLYSTYLGGNSPDMARAIAVDDKGNAYVAGQTASSDFPGMPNGAALPTAFFVRLDPGGTQVSPLGPPPGAYQDAFGIAAGRSAVIWTAGQTRPTAARRSDAFLLEFPAR